jgi:hypothetical protein
MPSPFPGMDPYLEHPDLFPDFHGRFVIYLADACQPMLPGPYYTATNRRAWIEVSARYVEPDVNIIRTSEAQTRRRDSGRAVALADDAAVKPVLIHVPHDELSEPYLDIYIGRGEQRRLVTHIEVLSPSNKSNSQQARTLYLKKQQEILNSNVNLIEIDLLRGGRHTTSVPWEQLQQHGLTLDYHVCVHRFTDIGDYLVYPIRLQDRLPEFDVPLLPEDGSVRLDLQAVFNRCYDAGPYAREIDYQHDEPEPPLTPQQAEWAKSLKIHANP